MPPTTPKLSKGATVPPKKAPPGAGFPPKREKQSTSTPAAAPLSASQVQEALQLKALTHWWSAALLGTDHKVRDLSKDLGTGVVAIALLEALTGTDIKHNKDPKNRLKELENCTIFIRQLRLLGIQPDGKVSAEDIADGKKAVLLNVTWKLMIHFLASTDSVGLEWLLEWVRVNTAGYPGVVVESWQSASLSNGRAFCALLHRFDPTVLDFDALPETDAEGASRAALEIAFETAATKFGAPMLLDAADVVGPASRASPTEGLDVKCMQALMLQLRQALRKCAEQRTKEAAILAERFTEDAAALVTWAREAEVALAGHSASAARLDRSDLSSGSSSVIEADKMLSELVQTFRGYAG